MPVNVLSEGSRGVRWYFSIFSHSSKTSVIFGPRSAGPCSFRRLWGQPPERVHLSNHSHHGSRHCILKGLPTPTVIRVSPLSSSGSCIVSCFTFRPMTHFKSVAVKGVRSVSRLLFRRPAPLVEDTVFAPLSMIDPQSTVLMGVYFWAPHSVPLMDLSVLSPTTRGLDRHSFAGSLEVKRLRSSDFAFSSISRLPVLVYSWCNVSTYPLLIYCLI